MINTPAGKFYLGDSVDPKTQNGVGKHLLYDSSNLTTHGVIVGMTGSGKTGLSINLLEEALHSNIPTIIIDPKGDMPNLTLQFPNLSAEEFLPWINRHDAQQRNMSPMEYSTMVAKSWEFGLKKSGIDKSRIRNLKEKTQFTIYTPGSDSGVSLNILDSFRCPPVSPQNNLEAFTDMVESTVQSLLGLLGLEGDPLQSREFILLSNILQDRWKNGEDLTLESIIGYVMNPPVKKLGVFDVDMLFPQKDRMQLAMLINNVIASPGFAAWIKGEPINPAKWMNRVNGKTPCSIFYLAHLSDSERMFFVTLLLGKIMNYARTLPGTSSLRSLLYFDEVFGYLPPYPKNPPSKTPILTILKQARAFGLGMVLATQNPVDLDYKALTNAGTWFVGKLQTDRDKKRVLDGLDSSSFASNHGEMDDLISNLETRNFILHSAHQKEPEIFRTRFAQAYLRGPVTRTQLKDMMDNNTPMPPVHPQYAPQPQQAPPPQVSRPVSPPAPIPAPIPVSTPVRNTRPLVQEAPQRIEEEPVSETEGYSPIKPELPPGVKNFYLNQSALRDDEIREMFEPFAVDADKVLYLPGLLAKVRLRFDEEKARLVHYKEFFRLIFPFTDDVMPVWTREDSPLEKDMISRKGIPNSLYASPSSLITDKSDAKKIKDDLVELLYSEESIKIFSNIPLKVYSGMNEELHDFERRCAQLVETKMEREMTKIKRKYERKLDTLSRKIDRTVQRIEDAKQDHTLRRSSEALHMGESLLGFFTKKKKSIGHAVSGAMNKHRMADRAQMRIKKYELEIEHLREEMDIINREMDDMVEDARSKYADMVNHIEEKDVSLEKNDIAISEFGLLWVPVSAL